MTALDPTRDRLLELLAGKALGDLNDSDQRELGSIHARVPSRSLGGEEAELELAAASAALAMLEAEGAFAPMPDGLSKRVAVSGDAFVAGRSSVDPSRGDRAPRESLVEGKREPEAYDEDGYAPGRAIRMGPRVQVWSRLAIAACVGLLVTAAALFLFPSGPASQREAFLSRAGDVVRLTWGDWALDGAPPEIASVKGDVVWSDSAQKGYMRFQGLPKNAPDTQYQLWIIDAERGMDQRISGAIFDRDSGAVGPDGELIVPIEPRLKVNKAAAFAITIEKPGGTWVSDMKRRVVIAARS